LPHTEGAGEKARNLNPYRRGKKKKKEVVSASSAARRRGEKEKKKRTKKRERVGSLLESAKGRKKTFSRGESNGERKKSKIRKGEENSSTALQTE